MGVMAVEAFAVVDIDAGLDVDAVADAVGRGLVVVGGAVVDVTGVLVVRVEGDGAALPERMDTIRGWG